MPSGRKCACSLAFLESRRLCQMRERDHPPHLLQPPHPPFVCRVCHFSSLDNSGLLQHLSVSQHCSTMMAYRSTSTEDCGLKLVFLAPTTVLVQVHSGYLHAKYYSSSKTAQLFVKLLANDSQLHCTQCYMPVFRSLLLLWRHRQ